MTAEQSYETFKKILEIKYKYSGIKLLKYCTCYHNTT